MNLLDKKHYDEHSKCVNDIERKIRWFAFVNAKHKISKEVLMSDLCEDLTVVILNFATCCVMGCVNILFNHLMLSKPNVMRLNSGRPMDIAEIVHEIDSAYDTTEVLLRDISIGESLNLENSLLKTIHLDKENSRKFYKDVKSKLLDSEDFNFISHCWPCSGDPGFLFYESKLPVFLDYLCIPQKRMFNTLEEWSAEDEKNFETALRGIDKMIKNCREFVVFCETKYLTRTWCIFELTLAILYKRRIRLVNDESGLFKVYLDNDATTIIRRLFRQLIKSSTTIGDEKEILIFKTMDNLRGSYNRVNDVIVENLVDDLGLIDKGKLSVI